MKNSLLCLPALLLPGTGMAQAPQSTVPHPNIVFIITDQQFAGAMSCAMGSEYLRTPTMDALAAEGTRFTRAYAATPLCMPSRAAMFSGRYPHETRVTFNGAPPGGLDPKKFVSMGVYFKDAGYEPAYSGKWHLCYNIKKPDDHGFEILRPRAKGNYDARVAAGAVQFLARKHDRPFLLVASFLNPHNICEWSRRLAGRKQRLNCGEIGTPPAAERLPPPPANLEPPIGEPDGMTLIRRAYQVPDGKFPVAGYTVEDWRKARWGYNRMVEKVDAEIGKVIQALHDAGLEDHTVVLFVSDHGECLGAHRFNQKTVLYEESTRVPLIIAGKGRTKARVCDKLVNTGIDILPTLLDAAGIEKPSGLPGRSLWPLALHRPVEDWRDHVVVENHMVQTGVVDGFKPEMQGRMVRTDRYKYCLFQYGVRRESLYDMKADPGETKNLAADSGHRPVLLKHRALLAAFAKKHHDEVAASMLADDVAPRPFPQKGKKMGADSPLPDHALLKPGTTNIPPTLHPSAP